MYPNNYFNLFPPFPRKNKVFVAMSFDKRFQPRWEHVIAPAICNVRVNDVPLEPHRVDTRQISDSILTEILGGISNDRLVFADVTSLGNFDGKPVRNGNVMYEVGLAHAIRLPEEVILFRSDSDSLLFDVANVRINSYKPDENPDVVRRQVANAIVEALNEVSLKQQLAVKAAAQSLDFPSWRILAYARGNNGIPHFQTRTMGEALGNAANNAAISRLLELGALTTDYMKVSLETINNSLDSTEQLIKYKPTLFGKAILAYAADEMGLLNPEVHQALGQMEND